MKFPAFAYERPTSVEGVLAALSSNPEAKLISGGQTLLPAMAFRMANPSLLIDLAGVEGLDRISFNGDELELGARTRWVDIETSELLKVRHPLLPHVISHVAHYQIRNRGTVGGSLAHADPAAEMPGLVVACDAQLDLARLGSVRTVPAAEFFVGALSTVLEAGEMLVRVRFPSWPVQRRWAFHEFARRQGDFAMAGVFVFYDEDAQGCMADPHVAVIGACQQPTRLAAVEQVLDGHRLSPDLLQAAVKAMDEVLEPPDDVHGSAKYRKFLALTLLKKSLATASSRQL